MDNIVRGSVLQALRILVSLIPLFAFWFIALGNSLIGLQIGILVGIGLTVVMAWVRLTRGTLLWATAAFFAVALVFVVGLNNVWMIEHLGVFPTSFLFVAVMLSMILDRPFIAEYAREEVSLEQQATTSFVRTCFWAAILLFMVLLSVVQLSYPAPGKLYYLFAQLGILLAALAYQANYIVHVRRQRVAIATASTNVAHPGAGQD